MELSDRCQLGTTCKSFQFGTGTIPRMPIPDTTIPLDAIPVDIVSNMMIVCAAYRLHLTNLKCVDGSFLSYMRLYEVIAKSKRKEILM